MTLLLTFIVAAYATLAVWAATSQRHWFVRAFVYCAALALLLPIKAYEPLVLFGFVAIALAGGAIAAPKLLLRPSAAGATQQSWRYGMQDLLFGFVVIGFAALVLGLLIRERIPLSWSRAALAAELVAVMAWLAMCVVRGPWRWQALGGLVLMVPVTAFMDAALGDWMLIDGLLLSGRFDVSISALWPRLAPRYGALAVWLVLFATGAAVWMQRERLGRTTWFWRAAFLLLLGPLLAGCGWIYWRMLVGPAVEAEHVAGENIYPRILEIASDLESATPAEAAEIYAQVLPLLSQPGHAVIDWQSPCLDPVERQIAHEQRTMKVLLWGLEAESERCRALGQPDAAARFAEAFLQLTRMAARGGKMADSMAVNGSLGSLAEIARMRRSVSSETAQRLSRLIESLENEREAPAVILAREARYRFVNERWRYRLLHVWWVDWFRYKSVPDPYDNLVEPWSNRFATLARLLSLDLALRTYRADHGEWPVELSELVPDYLGAIPHDPMSSQPFVYRPEEPEFVLYSLGFDGEDDGGRCGNLTQVPDTRRGNRGFDVDVDTLTRP